MAFRPIALFSDQHTILGRKPSVPRNNGNTCNPIWDRATFVDVGLHLASYAMCPFDNVDRSTIEGSEFAARVFDITWPGFQSLADVRSEPIEKKYIA